MLAGHEQNLPETLLSEMPRFSDYLIDRKGNAQNRIIAREPAVTAIVDAFIGKIERREEPHGASEILQSERARPLCHCFQLGVGFGRDKIFKPADQGRFFERKVIERLRK